MSFPKAILTALLLCLMSYAVAQQTNQGETFTLNATLDSTQSHDYAATRYIDLTPGFLSRPGTGNSTTLRIDPYGVFPPGDGLTGGPNPQDHGVVGAIGGTIDVGIMGAAVYAIPINVPQGINGMTPNFSITYNSQTGTGLLGWGWNLTGLSAIERSGRTRYHDGVSGAVTMDDITDRLTIDGHRLIAVADFGDSVEFKTELDDMSKVMAYYAMLSSEGDKRRGPLRTISCFKVWTSDGRILDYGGTIDSRLTLQNSGPMALRWMLNRSSDRNGNAILYHYETHSDTGESYLSSIDYTEHTEEGVVISVPEFTVHIIYRQDPSNDLYYRYVAGNLIQAKRLIDRISIIHNPTDEEVGRYSFVYRRCDPGNFYDTVKMHDRLDTIRFERGGVALNPTVIRWSDQQNETVVSTVLMNQQDSLIYKNYPFVGDFNGDGYSDLAVVPLKDSAYANIPTVNVYLNNPQDPGHFLHNPSITVAAMEKTLEWLFPVDLNDDGLDDLVALFHDSVSPTGRDTMTVKVLENVNGGCFVCSQTVGFGGARVLVRCGDFLARGYNQLLLIPIDPNGMGTSQSPILMLYENGSLTAKVSTSPLLGMLDLVTGDFDGDGGVDIIVVKESSSSVYRLGVEGSQLRLNHIFSSNAINHAGGRWNHVFAGDFNGDGITDLLYAEHSTNGLIYRIFHGTGTSLSSPESIMPLGVYLLPPSNIYSHSLRQASKFLLQPYFENYWNYGLCVADFDGDGSDDIAATTMNPTYSSVNIYCDYNPATAQLFGSVFRSSWYNGHHTGPNINCRSQYFHLGNFLGMENISFLGLEYRNTNSTNNQPGVFSLKPQSVLNSVATVTDGLGCTTNLSYTYVQQQRHDQGYGVRTLPVPIRTLSSITTYNVSGRAVEKTFSFTDPYYHRDGHGWIGFGRSLLKRYIAGVETSRTVSRQSLDAMTTHAIPVPSSDSVFVFPNGEPVIASVTTHAFTKALNIYGSSDPDRHVTSPVLTGRTVTEYDPNSQGTVLSKTFIENYYNLISGSYSHNYRCDSIRTGIGGSTAGGFSTCESRIVESIEYWQDDYASWTLNRPHIVTTVRSRTGKPDVGSQRVYEYLSSRSFLVSHIQDIPSRTASQHPLMLKEDFEYHPNGNLSRKILSAPQGQHGELPKTVEFEYGASNLGRLPTKVTESGDGLSYAFSYAYDAYDRVDTITAPSGLASAFSADPIGVTTWTHKYDSTSSCEAIRWSQGHPLAPSGALYYSWLHSSDGSQRLIFYHKTGAKLREVACGIHGEPILTDFQYDSRGRLSALSDPYMEEDTPRWTLYTYDGLDRITTTTSPDGTVTETFYNGLTTQSVITPPLGPSRQGSVTVNAMGWTVRSDDASGSYVTYDHYADGLPASATVNGVSASTVEITYDDARNQTSITDPDYGTSTTVYDAFGRLVTSASPREAAMGRNTTYTYDVFDRGTGVDEGLEGSFTSYEYNETGKAKGTLNKILLNRAGTDIQRISYAYDSLARVVSETDTRLAGVFTTTYAYDGQSRVSRITHPSGTTLCQGYSHGWWTTVSDGDGNVLWRTTKTDPQGHLAEARMGNGAVTSNIYDPATGRLQRTVTTKNLQDISYTFDKLGNLAVRKDNLIDMEETFTYDGMDRLTGITLMRPSGADVSCSMGYDALGRMTSRQSVVMAGSEAQSATVFSSPVFDPVKIHTMTKATTSSSLIPSDAQIVTYTGFDKAATLTQGDVSLTYSYGHDHQRINMDETSLTGTKHKDYVGRCEFVTETSGNATSQRTWTFVDGPYGVFAVVESVSGTSSFHYVLKDHIGSWTVVTDSEGGVERRQSFDAWGNPRDPDTWGVLPLDNGLLFDRGFTGHEHLCSFGLINMNGRMYDPVVSSFLSPDRFIQEPFTAQSFNRYAYCGHNPLRYVDPSGWLSGNGNGNGHQPDEPLQQVVIDGQANFILPEITITPYDTSASWVEFVFTPHCPTGGSPDQDGSDAETNTPLIGAGGGGNIGLRFNNRHHDHNDHHNVNLEIASDVLITINTYTAIQGSLHYNRLTRTWMDKNGIFRSFDFHGNQYTGGMKSYGKAMKTNYAKASGVLSVIGIGISIGQMSSAESIDDRIQYGSDICFGVIGLFPGGNFISTFWFFGGRDLVFQYGESMGELIKSGINPGLPVYQPFK